MNKHFLYVVPGAISIAALAALGACGGGGDGGGSTGAAVPASSASSPAAPGSGVAGALPPQTTVPAPTYEANSVRALVYARLNQYREAMGVGLVAQDTNLDTAAQAHAQYLVTNLASGALTALSHDESSTLPGFYAVSPLARGRKAGVSSAMWIGEVAGSGYPQSTAQAYADDCVESPLDTVYHLQGLTANNERAGIGFQPGTNTYPNYACVIDGGSLTNVPANPIPNGFPQRGGQQISANAIVHSPYTDENNVSTEMHAESPSPAPDLTSPGRPIMVRVNASEDNVLTVSNFQLTDSTGAVVPARILVNDQATGSKAVVQSDPKVFPGVAFLLPLSPLKPNTKYTVMFVGVRDTTSVSTTWNFTTAP